MLDLASNFALDQDGGLRDTALRERRRPRRPGPSTLIVTGKDEPLGMRSHVSPSNLQRLPVTDTGALDMKDVLRYERIIFTTDAFDAIGANFTAGKAKYNGTHAM